MKKVLAVVTIAAPLASVAFVAWTLASHTDDTSTTVAAGGSFDLDVGPARADRLRDSVASPASPKPIALAEMTAATSPAPSAAAAPAVRPFLTPTLENAARTSRLFARLLEAPSRLMGSGTALRSPRDLRVFLSDKAAVESYLDSTMVRVVLNSPVVAKALLGSPAVVRAFLSTPALQDPAAVQALLSSRMLVKILDCPGIQEALSDPAVVRGMAGPETAEFLARNPGAVQALAAAAPGLTRALTR